MAVVAVADVGGCYEVDGKGGRYLSGGHCDVFRSFGCVAEIVDVVAVVAVGFVADVAVYRFAAFVVDHDA